MSFPLAYSALRWENPNLEQTLVQLREAGWGRLGGPSVARLARFCASRHSDL